MREINMIESGIRAKLGLPTEIHLFGNQARHSLKLHIINLERLISETRGQKIARSNCRKGYLITRL